MICLACDDAAEKRYDLRFERRDGDVRDVTAPLCARCADDLLARDWIAQRAASVIGD
ncbi:MAG: hypothetical protein ABEH78_09765 [Haloferacaceae archaeon]